MKRTLSVVAVVVLALVSIPHRIGAVQDTDTAVIAMEPGQVMLELVGQMVDVPTDLPRSKQFGFLSFIKGLANIFVSPPGFDGTTAKFGFLSRVTITREIVNGPLVIITGEGVTEITFTPCPVCVSPLVDVARGDSSLPVFLIQTSALRQQLIVDSDTRSFTIVNVNTITDVRPFTMDGTQYQLGQVGQVFRTSLGGQLDPVRLTEGHFAGHAVGVPSLTVH